MACRAGDKVVVTSRSLRGLRQVIAELRSEVRRLLVMCRTVAPEAALHPDIVCARWAPLRASGPQSCA